MPSYRVTAPDGAMYDVTPPEGTNPSETEILAQVQGQAAPGAGKSTRAVGLTEHFGKAMADVIAPPTGDPTIFQRAADAVVPSDPSRPTLPGAMAEPLKTPTGAGGVLGTLLPSILQAVPQTRAIGALANSPAGRTLGGTVGAGIGAMVEGKDPMEEGAQAGGFNALVELVLGGGGKLVRSLPTVKGRIAEGQARGIVDAIRRVSPELADTVAQNRGAVAPTLRGPRTGAALQETALGERGARALSDVMERGITEAERASGGALIMGPALLDAYAAMPKLAQDQLVGAVAPGGFTLRQAQEVVGWLGSKAFTESPLGQGVGKVPQQKLWGQAMQETVGALDAADPTKAASAAFLGARSNYAGGSQYLDLLRSGSPEGPFRSYGNRLNLDENMARRVVSEHRMELADKLGPAGFQALQDALGGAQLGTKSLMAPGGGGATDALAQVYGRGQGGAPQIAGSAIRTILPNIGYQAAGRVPYTLPPYLQAILDAALQRAGAAGLEGAQR